MWAKPDLKLLVFLCLTISSSTGSILPIVLSAHHMAKMVFLTSSHLYSAYPNMTQNGESILLDDKEPVTVYPLQIRQHLLEFERPCGIACPTLEHSLFWSKQVGCIVWNSDHVDEDQVERQADESIFWKIGRDCKNPWCKSYTKHCDWIQDLCTFVVTNWLPGSVYSVLFVFSYMIINWFTKPSILWTSVRCLCLLLSVFLDNTWCTFVTMFTPYHRI